jgi:orotidine-5'-phosphate decarboxylase
MGSDSVKPFLEFEGKWAIVLALTSNEGAKDFQLDTGKTQQPYKHVLRTSSQWGTPDNMMYVVGATKANMFEEVRAIVPHHFLLVPGVGAQGGNLADVCKHGLIKNDIGLLINSSRAIIYASSDANFAEAAAVEAKKVADEMSTYF